MRALLIGAGGHAKAVVEAIRGRGGSVEAYVDPRPAAWLKARRIEADDAVPPAVVVRRAGEPGPTRPPKRGGGQARLPKLYGGQVAVVIGLGGVTVQALVTRLALFDSYLARGFPAPPVVHAAAHVSAEAELGPGAVVLAGAVVQPGVRVERGAIINTGAIVEHDSAIGPGSHIAPGAVVLGGCRIGACSVIGAGAVVLPGARIKDRALVPAATLHPGGAPAAKEAS